MKTRFQQIGLFALLMSVVAMIAVADDAKDDAIKKDRKLIAGTWRVVLLDVNGTRASDDDAKKLTVVNSEDGAWKLLSDGIEIRKGTSLIDPTKFPKTIDFETVDDGGMLQKFTGIYEVEEKTRKLCFAESGKPRPTEFSSKPDSEQILVSFEREAAN